MTQMQNRTTEKGAFLTETPYPVTEVAGRPPAGLDDLVGATSLTVSKDGLQYRLVGTGVRADDRVLFHQKEVGSAAEDDLIWSIQDKGDGDLVAHPPHVD